MLDNTELIETLDETKSKATEVSEKLEMASKTSVDIDKLRDGYIISDCAFYSSLNKIVIKKIFYLMFAYDKTIIND